MPALSQCWTFRKGTLLVRVPHQLLILCSIGLAGWYIANSFPESQSQTAFEPSAFELAAGDAVDDQAADAWQTSDQLVQEPARSGSRRTARRPDYEVSSKYSHSFSMLQAFREVVAPAYKSTVELLVDDQLQAYGTVVDADGWIVTKDSQLPPSGKLVCRVWTREEYDTQIVSRNSSLDLALIRIERRGLEPIKWSDEVLPGRGSWVATTSIQDTPAAFGIVSAGLISVGARKVRMGVVLREDAGAVIEKVYFGTGAADAGLRRGDRIRAIDGQKLTSQQEALDVLKTCRAGQCVQLTIERGTSEMDAQVRMMDLSEDLTDETEMEVNGSISARSSGFSSVFLHDTVLRPNQCGGPLVNLDGQAVGLNIARAGRVCSYALPTAVVRPQIDQMLASAKASPVLTNK